VPSKGSRRAAVIAGEGREDLQKTLEDRDAERRGIPLLNWAFTTIRDVLLPFGSASPSERYRQGKADRDPADHWGVS
jgi:hypothetical protein